MNRKKCYFKNIKCVNNDKLVVNVDDPQILIGPPLSTLPGGFDTSAQPRNQITLVGLKATI